MVIIAPRWSPSDCAQHVADVPAPGAEALQLLAPAPGELILDLGCGDGALTAAIAAAGARVIGLDSSPDMVEAARARGVDAFVADAGALDLERFGQFDAVFSNAALHWMTDPDAAASGILAVLKEGGRFVGEMGGAGDLALIRRALEDELGARGYKPPEADSAWYPDVEAFTRLYCVAGFADVRAQLIERPTALPGGVSGWITAFRSELLDLAMVPEWEREDLGAAVERRLEGDLLRPDGGWFADHVRLRFAMKKPE